MVLWTQYIGRHNEETFNHKAILESGHQCMQGKFIAKVWLSQAKILPSVIPISEVHRERISSSASDYFELWNMNRCLSRQTLTGANCPRMIMSPLAIRNDKVACMYLENTHGAKRACDRMVTPTRCTCVLGQREHERLHNADPLRWTSLTCSKTYYARK